MHRIVVDRVSGSTIVTATGELDAFVTPDLTSAFEAVRAEPRVLADLDGVSFMDSTALGLLVRAARELEAAGSRFRVVLPGGSARRIFEITALDRVLPVAENRAAALVELAKA